MPKWAILAVAVLWLVIGGGIIAFQDTKVIVKPQELAFILQNGRIVRELKPGVYFKIPFLQSVAYVEPHHIHRQPVVIKGILSDGHPCKITAELAYQIVNSRAAIEWKYANKYEISRKVSKKFNYQYPRRFVENMLRQRMLETALEEAANGAIEKWIWSGSTKVIRTKTHADGTRIVQLKITGISCSNNKNFAARYSHPKRKYGKPQPFASSQSGTPHEAKVYKGKPFSITAVLNDGRFIIIDNLMAQFIIVNEGRFNKYFATGADGQSMVAFRLTAYISGGLMRNVVRADPAEISHFNFASPIRPGSYAAKKLDNWGIQLIAVSSSETSYRLQTRGAK